MLYGMDLATPAFSDSTEFKTFYVALHNTTTFRQTKRRIPICTNRYFNEKCFYWLHSLVRCVQTFTARTCHVMNISTNHLQEGISIRTDSSQKPLLWGTDSLEDTSPIITILSS